MEVGGGGSGRGEEVEVTSEWKTTIPAMRKSDERQVRRKTLSKSRIDALSAGKRQLRALRDEAGVPAHDRDA